MLRVLRIWFRLGFSISWFTGFMFRNSSCMSGFRVEAVSSAPLENLTASLLPSPGARRHVIAMPSFHRCSS